MCCPVIIISLYFVSAVISITERKGTYLYDILMGEYHQFVKMAVRHNTKQSS